MSKNTSPEEVTLEVGLAYQDPANNLRTVRLPAKIMFQLDVLVEDVVQIQGGPLLAQMDVLVWAAYPEDDEANRLIARVNKPIMKSLELNEGDLIKIRLSAFQMAARQRREMGPRAKEGKVLTEDDLLSAEVTDVDKIFEEDPEKMCANGEYVLIPQSKNILLLVGEEEEKSS